MFNPIDTLSNIANAFKKGSNQPNMKFGFWVRGGKKMPAFVNADFLCFNQVAWNLITKACTFAKNSIKMTHWTTSKHFNGNKATLHCEISFNAEESDIGNLRA